MKDPLIGHNGGVPGVPAEPEERCELTELPRSGCAHCHPKPKPPGFHAMYEGTCPRCSGPIKVGDLIRETDSGGYEHAGHR